MPPEVTVLFLQSVTMLWCDQVRRPGLCLPVRVIDFVGFLSDSSSSFGKSTRQARSVAPNVSSQAPDLDGAHMRLKARQARGDTLLAAETIGNTEF